MARPKRLANPPLGVGLGVGLVEEREGEGDEGREAGAGEEGLEDAGGEGLEMTFGVTDLIGVKVVEVEGRDEVMTVVERVRGVWGVGIGVGTVLGMGVKIEGRGFEVDTGAGVEAVEGGSHENGWSAGTTSFEEG